MRWIVTLCVSAVCASPASAMADTTSSVEAKAVACRACHVGARAFAPRLAAQRGAYLVAQLTAFKKGDRKNELMQAIASQLSDDDMQSLAQYWGKQPAGDDTDTPAATAIQTSPMTFPAGFPTGFTVYKTENDAEAKTVSKSYANAVALAAAKANKPLPNGSIIMVVTYAGDRVQSYSGMESKAGYGAAMPELVGNGGWTYRLFDQAQKPRDVNQARCLACHKPAAAKSYVFTLDAMCGKK